MPETPVPTRQHALQSADVQAELRHYVGIAGCIAGLGVPALVAGALVAGRDGTVGLIGIVALVGGAVAAATGIGMLLRVRRQRTVLAVNPFVSYALAIETGPESRRGSISSWPDHPRATRWRACRARARCCR